MKKQKGFTLVELLAVIVILAIIALIAVPIVMNVIEDARKGAAKSSALGYIDATEKTAARNLLDSDKTNDIGIGKYNVENLTVKVKGEKPTEGCITIATNGVISDYSLKIGKYIVNKKGNTQEVIKNGSVRECSGEAAANSGSGSGSYKTYTVGEAISYNPTTNQKCDSPVSTTGTKSGCMKWYVIKDNGSSVDVILDHNTTATVSYHDGYDAPSSYAEATIKTHVDSDATGWASGLNPRLITANEVAAITGNTEFDGKSNKDFYFGSNNSTRYSSQTEEQKAKQRNFAWLFDHTYDCTNYGCNTADSSINGYWTSSRVLPSDLPFDGQLGNWSVQYDGYLGYSDGLGYACNFDVEWDSEFACGIRPVITIQKSVIN